MNAIALAARRRAEETSSDFELAGLARDGDEPAIRLIVRRHNQQLFRVARSIVRNDAEAEDVVQATYVKAFTSLASFRGVARPAASSKRRWTACRSPSARSSCCATSMA